MTVSKQTTYQSDTKAAIEGLTPAIGTIARTTDTNELGVYGASGWDFIRRNRTVGCTDTLDGVADMPVPYYNLDFSDSNISVLNDAGTAASDGDAVSRVTGGKCVGVQDNALYQPTYVTANTSVVGDKGTSGDQSVNVSVNNKAGLYFEYTTGMNFDVVQTGATEYTSFHVYSVPCVYNARRVTDEVHRRFHNHLDQPANIYRPVFYDRFNNYTDAGWFPSLEWYANTNSTFFYYQRVDSTLPNYIQRHDFNNTNTGYYDPLDYDEIFLNKTYIFVTRYRTQALDEHTNPASPNPLQADDSNRVDVLSNLPSGMEHYIKPASVVRYGGSYFQCEKTHVSNSAPSTSMPEWKTYTPDVNDNLVNDAQRVISNWVSGRTYWGPPAQRLADDPSRSFQMAASKMNGGPTAKFDNHHGFNHRAATTVGRTGYEGWFEGNNYTTLPHVLHQRVEFTEYLTNEQIFNYSQALRTKWNISNMTGTTDLTQQYVELEF